MTCGVYVIRLVSSTPEQCYVGSSVNIENRWEAHIASLIKGSHCNLRLQAAWSKHGREAFSFKITKVIRYSTSSPDVQARLLREEQKQVDYWRAAYNITQPISNLKRVAGLSYDILLIDKCMVKALKNKSLVGIDNLVFDNFENEFTSAKFNGPRDPQWYVLRYVSGKEKTVLRLLNYVGIEYKYLIFMQKMTRSKPVERPWLPGYLFVSLDAKKDNWGQILRMPYALEVLGDPTALPPGLVDDLVLRLPLRPAKPSAFSCIAPGTRVRFRSGAFQGHEGPVMWSERRKLKVMLMLFNTPKEIETDVSNVEIV